MSRQEIISLLRNVFENTEVIDLTKPETTRISGVNELETFFLGSGETILEVQRKGIASLRKGFYKIIEPPFYKSNLQYPTFAATVLYYRDNPDRLIKFIANIGPLTNSHVRYSKNWFGSTQQDILWEEFTVDRSNDTWENYYYESKKRFYEKSYNLNKMLVVQTSDYSAIDPNFKAVEWNFIT